jgi:hypothetical protein
MMLIKVLIKLKNMEVSYRGQGEMVEVMERPARVFAVHHDAHHTAGDA